MPSRFISANGRNGYSRTAIASSSSASSPVVSVGPSILSPQQYGNQPGQDSNGTAPLSLENFLAAFICIGHWRCRSAALCDGAFSKTPFGSLVAHAAASTDYRADHAEHNAVCRIHFVRPAPGAEGRDGNAGLA